MFPRELQSPPLPIALPLPTALIYIYWSNPLTSFQPVFHYLLGFYLFSPNPSDPVSNHVFCLFCPLCEAFPSDKVAGLTPWLHEEGRPCLALRHSLWPLKVPITLTRAISFLER